MPLVVAPIIEINEVEVPKKIENYLKCKSKRLKKEIKKSSKNGENPKNEIFKRKTDLTYNVNYKKIKKEAF